jgi:hypothetical protein
MRTTPRVAGFKSEYPAGFELECMAGFIGIRKDQGQNRRLGSTKSRQHSMNRSV